MAVTDYCTLAELKAALNLGTQTYADPDISLAISAASRAIDQKTGRRFWKDDNDVTRKFVPRSAGFVPTDDIAAFTSFTVQGTVWTQDTDFYLEPINAVADNEPYTGIRAIGRPFIYTEGDRQPGSPVFDGRVSVVGKFGWPAVPAEISEACRLLAVRLMRRIREATFGVLGLGLEGEGVRILGVDPDVEALVRPYAKLWLG